MTKSCIYIICFHAGSMLNVAFQPRKADFLLGFILACCAVC